MEYLQKFERLESRNEYLQIEQRNLNASLRRVELLFEELCKYMKETGQIEINPYDILETPNFPITQPISEFSSRKESRWYVDEGWERRLESITRRNDELLITNNILKSGIDRVSDLLEKLSNHVGETENQRKYFESQSIHHQSKKIILDSSPEEVESEVHDEVEMDFSLSVVPGIHHSMDAISGSESSHVVRIPAINILEPFKEKSKVAVIKHKLVVKDFGWGRLASSIEQLSSGISKVGLFLLLYDSCNATSTAGHVIVT